MTLDELEKLAREATPGPLRVEEVRWEDGTIEYELWADDASGDDRLAVKVLPAYMASSGKIRREHGNRKALAELISAANPAVVLALVNCVQVMAERHAECEQQANYRARPDRNYECSHCRALSELDAALATR
jgi:hypothetical protein